LGDVEVLLGPHGNAALPLEWKRPVTYTGPNRTVPSQLAFVITVQLTDTTGNRVSESATVLERLPRSWEIF
jgi:hypothetical protein